MGDPAPGQMDGLLARLRAGDEAAGRELFTLLYDELKAIAGRQLARIDSNHTLQATELVHEVWLKLGKGEAAESRDYASRFHFCCTAAKAMRSVLVDHARERGADKRGGGRRTLSLDETGAVSSVDLPAAGTVELLPLNEALERLRTEDVELGEIVELRFFAGLGNEEIAALRDLSLATIERRFAVARAWLHREMKRADAERAS